jgi:hypothetical protein
LDLIEACEDAKPGFTGTTEEQEILGMLKNIEKAETAH